MVTWGQVKLEAREDWDVHQLVIAAFWTRLEILFYYSSKMTSVASKVIHSNKNEKITDGKYESKNFVLF